MQNKQKSPKSMSGHAFTQFELTQKLLQCLNIFNLTPTGKLVLLYLSSCYNPKHGEMFPKQRTIADKLGISEASVIRALCELHKEGLVISERKYTNRYKYTSKFLISLGISDDKMRVKNYQNKIKETCNLTDHDMEQTKRTNKEPVAVEDYKILKDYAINHKAENVNAYVNWLIKTGNDKKILRKHKQVSLRYQTGELKRLMEINQEKNEPISKDYFEKIREMFANLQ